MARNCHFFLSCVGQVSSPKELSCFEILVRFDRVLISASVEQILLGSRLLGHYLSKRVQSLKCLGFFVFFIKKVAILG